MFYRQKVRKKPEIQLAPFIDVVFLLLIFFMVTTVFPDNQGLLIEKPGVDAADTILGETISLSLTKTGDIYYKGKKIGTDQVESILRAEKIKNLDVALVITADRNSSTGALVTILDRARTAGLDNVSLATERQQQP